MKTTNLMAVDLGASGGKCFVGTFRDGAFTMSELHRFEYEGVPFFAADARGHVSERTYWDDIFIHRNILDGLRAYRREVSDTLDGLAVDTWGADGQFVTPDGDVLGKVYCYRDQRLDTMIAALKARVNPRRVYEITGIHFQPFNVSNQLLWFSQNRPELLALPGLTYLPVPSIFTYYLGGYKVVDSSWASVTQLMDAATRRWSPELLAAVGVPEKVMPRIVPPATVLGGMFEPLAKTLGFSAPPRLVAVASHDTASAFAAAPAARPEDALIISSGTWSILGRLLPAPITTEAAMEANISNEGGIGNVRFLRNCMGGWLAQELRRSWRNRDGRETSWAELDALTASAPAFSAWVDPDDPSFYKPADMQKALTAFCLRTGQQPPADRGACLRVVYESLALKYRWVNDRLGAVCGRPARVVHIVGGGSGNEMLNQFTADALGLPVVAGPKEGTAVGNLMTQAVGLGLLGSIADAQPVIREAFPVKQYTPRDRASWDRAYARFAAHA